RARRSIVVRFHIPFWRRVKLRRAARIAPLVEASAPHAVRDPTRTSATLEKPLIRESLVYPSKHLSTTEGSGLFAVRTPRLPRILFHNTACNFGVSTKNPFPSLA